MFTLPSDCQGKHGVPVWAGGDSSVWAGGDSSVWASGDSSVWAIDSCSSLGLRLDFDQVLYVVLIRFCMWF